MICHRQCSFLALSLVLFAQTLCPQRLHEYSVTPFSHLTDNVKQVCGGSNLYWYATSVASSYLLIETDIDYRVHTFFFRTKETYNPYTLVALWGGYAAPLLVGGGMAASGYLTNDASTYAAGCAVLQATALSSFAVAALKAVTGRARPDPTSYADMRAASRLFRFGLFRGGIHYGWPSGHLAVNSAIVTCLMSYYRDNVAAKYVGSAGIVYLVFGVSAHEGATMHWLSDVVAGTILGCVIGTTVGSSFRGCNSSAQDTEETSSASLTPFLSPNTSAICLTIPL